MEPAVEEFKAPTWMDKTFFEKMMRSSENDQKIVVKDFIVRPGSKPGDNYASEMYRITINYKSEKLGEKTQKVVLKTTYATDGLHKDLMEDSPLFDVEIKMYTKTLQDIDRLLKSIGEKFTLSPRYIYHEFEPRPVLVMEDISPLGYVMLEKQMNLDQSFLVMSRLAKFHAASMYLGENNGDVKSYDKSFYTTDSDLMNKMFKENINFFTKELKSWGPEYEIYYEKFVKIKDDIVKLGDHLFLKNENDNGYNVLTHGDFHSRNLLVKWDEESKKVDDLILLDFQVCFWASPALHIIYALYLMMDSDVRYSHRGELISHYHIEFADTLKKLGFMGKIPSLLDVNMEILKKGKYEVVLATCFLHFNFMDLSAPDFDLETFFKNDENGMKAISMRNPDFLKAVRRELPIFLYKGLLK